jgi:transposase-like protein/IS1 family transposase
VNCHCCNGEAKYFAKFQNKNRVVRRFRCVRCNKTFSEPQPLDGLRVDFDKVCQAVHLLCESVGIRAISRLTGLNRNTVLRILETAGQKAHQFLNDKVRNVKVEQVQVDELINFVYSRGQNTPHSETERGDFATYLSVDRASKLIINWHVGKRDRDEAMTFLTDLRLRVPNRFQLTTDGWITYSGYTGTVREVFGVSIDYATEIKNFGRYNPAAGWRQSPMKLIGVTKKKRINNPCLNQATTSHAERTNLSVRTFNRRFTRCTLGYSKKLDNLKHAVALFVWHFNFVRKHSAHGQTPAQAAKLTENTMTIEDLLGCTI